jgi:hypothetical protein
MDFTPPNPPAYVVQIKEKKMSTEILRDNKGHKIGSIKRENGVEKMYDENGHYKGQYRDSDNITRDREGHKTGTGNQNSGNLSK